jgi:hypothetical protein
LSYSFIGVYLTYILPPQPPVYIRPTSGLAVASMVLGILGVLSICIPFLGLILSSLALVFGHFGMSETKDGSKSGHGMLISGLVLGYIGIAPNVMMVIFFITGSGISLIS